MRARMASKGSASRAGSTPTRPTNAAGTGTRRWPRSSAAPSRPRRRARAHAETMAAGQAAETVADGRTADFFRAAADPTRRALLDLLAEQGPLTVGQLAARFPQLVPSGISKHLMLLRQLGFVQAVKQGRERSYQL